MWHASVHASTALKARRYAHEALWGVGDPALGQWEDPGPGRCHLRRRLSAAEVVESGLRVQDLRGFKDEVLGRWHALGETIPPGDRRHHVLAEAFHYEVLSWPAPPTVVG